MRSFWWMLLPVLALAAHADPGDRVREMVLSMPSAYKDRWIDLRTDQPADATRWADKMRDAYRFDRRLQGLDTVRALDAPLIVGLASDETIKKFVQTTMGGRAVGDDMFASHITLFRDRPDFAWFVAAHELEHVLMRRLHAEEPEVPVYIFEGIACALGDRFVVQFDRNTTYLTNSVKRLSAATAADASDIIQNYRLPEATSTYRASGRLFLAEHLGGLFIEFLLARSGDSPDQFYGRFGALWQQVGNGARFAPAFERRFGITLEEAEKQFVLFMQTTQNEPKKRFQKTVYETISAASRQYASRGNLPPP